MNGTTASDQSVIDESFIELGIENNDLITTRINLTATALTKYETQCVAFDVGNAKQQLSDIGICNLELSFKPISLN